VRAPIGYVHAISHQLGGLFHISHGDANAMLLPHVLSYYIERELRKGKATPCCNRLCELAKAAGIVSEYQMTEPSIRDTMQNLVNYIVKMNNEMDIPTFVAGMKLTDVDLVARRALTEAHGNGSEFGFGYLMDPGLPVPMYMTLAECEQIVRKCLPDVDPADGSKQMRFNHSLLSCQSTECGSSTLGSEGSSPASISSDAATFQACE